MQDVASGRLLGAHSARGADIFALADDLTGRILGNLNVRPTNGTRGVAQVTSSSTEAYRLYTEGMRARHLLRLPDARKLLEQAVAIDQSFAAAWLELGDVAGGMDDRAAEAKYRDKTLEHVESTVGTTAMESGDARGLARGQRRSVHPDRRETDRDVSG